jgi:glutaminyl-peptide cyclotransferase
MVGRRNTLGWVILAGCLTILVACSEQSCNADKKKPQTTTQPSKPLVKAPDFSADSAFAFVKRQVDFGPRVPGSKAHQLCGDWMMAKLKTYGAAVMEQKTTLYRFDGANVPVRNIIASFQPEKTNRIFLCAHWDSRPFGDKDPDAAKQGQPIDGANDGASGAAVLLEIARLLATQTPEIGIDLIFFDTEDMGSPESFSQAAEQLNPGYSLTWCLGSQYWIRNPHKAGYKPKYGILLDMVGSKEARFNKEKFSMERGEAIVNKIWSRAAQLGYGGYFDQREVQGVVDDHFAIMEKSSINCIDIIDTRPRVAAMGLPDYAFGPFHHTHQDNMSGIHPEPLKAVGQTLLEVLYNE